MTFPFTSADVARFRSFVDVLPNGCHFWTGARSRGKGNKKWYGSFWVSKHTDPDTGVVTPGHTVRAHIFAAVALGCGHQSGMHQDHLPNCAFTLCVNPEHLECVDRGVNQYRMVERRRAARRA